MKLNSPTRKTKNCIHLKCSEEEGWGKTLSFMKKKKKTLNTSKENCEYGSVLARALCVVALVSSTKCTCTCVYPEHTENSFKTLNN